MPSEKQVFIRFIAGTRHSDSGTPQGIFCAAYALRDDETKNVPAYAREQADELIQWFKQNLKIPGRFNSSKSKGYSPGDQRSGLVSRKRP